LNVAYTSWPLEQTHFERLYLSGDPHLQVTPGTTTVQSSYPARTGQSVFTYRFASDTQLTGYLKAHLWVGAKDSNEADFFVLVDKHDKDGHLLVPGEMSPRQHFPIPLAGAHCRLRASLKKLDPELSTDSCRSNPSTNPKCCTLAKLFRSTLLSCWLQKSLMPASNCA
jgi:hypothetical protein